MTFFEINFLIAFMLGAVLLLALARNIGIQLFEVSIPSISFWSLFCFSYVGLLPLFFHLDSARIAMGLTDNMLISEIFLISIWSIISFLLGLRFFSLLKNKGGTVYKNISQLHTLKNSHLIVMGGFYLFSMVVLCEYLLQFEQIALFASFFGTASEVELIRSNMTNNFQGKYHWYHLFNRHWLNVIAYILFANVLVKRTLTNTILFLVAFLSASFTSLMAGEKAPFLWIIIGLFLVYCVVVRDRKIPLKGLGILFGSVFGILMCFFILFAGFQSAGSAIISVFSRTFTGEITPVYFYLQYFPAVEEFLYGRSFPNPGGLLPYSPFNLPVTIMHWKMPQLSDRGVVGSMPTVFWGEIYANFGYIGLSLIPFFVGGFISIVSSVLSFLKESPIKVGLLIWLVLHYKNISSAGIGMFIIDIYLIGVLFLIFGILLGSKLLKKLLKA